MTNAPTEVLAASELPTSENPVTTFVDRRNNDEKASGFERRQFGNSHSTLSPDARELAEAIDAYKVEHRRRLHHFRGNAESDSKAGLSKAIAGCKGTF